MRAIVTSNPRQAPAHPVPAAAVIREVLAYSIRTRQASTEAHTRPPHDRTLTSLSGHERFGLPRQVNQPWPMWGWDGQVRGDWFSVTLGVAVKCGHIERTAFSEGG